MRYDMHEAVIERPRSGMRYKYPRSSKRYRLGRDNENLPTKEGMRRPWKICGEYKELTDLISPLRRFLISRVGQRWNDVYSEIRERLDASSTVKIHIMSHVFDYVYRSACLNATGEVCAFNRYKLDPGKMYVHPKTGILCRIPEARPTWKRSRDKVDDPDKKNIGDREVRRIGGLWYWIKETQEQVMIRDNDTNLWVTQNWLDKRQINSRDLRRYNLT